MVVKVCDYMVGRLAGMVGKMVVEHVCLMVGRIHVVVEHICA
jgi:hypothetical protein